MLAKFVQSSLFYFKRHEKNLKTLKKLISGGFFDGYEKVN